MRLSRSLLVLAALSLAIGGCSSKKGDDDDDDIVGDGDADSDADTDSDADGDTDGDGDTDADGDGDCPTEPCAILEQCGCRNGEACDFGEGGALACHAAGTGEQGDACGQGNPCNAGLTCLADGKCAAFCDQGVHECPPGAQCAIQLNDKQGNPLAMVCLSPDNCDLLAPDCPDGETCIIVNPQDGTTDCTPPGNTAVDAECEYTNECVAGATCIQFNDENVGHCLQHCNTEGEPSCPDNHTCTELAGGPAGVCRIGGGGA